MSIHYLLKAGRRESGLSLREAAAALSVSVSTLYRYEEGLVASIPEEKARHLLRFYMPYLQRLYERLEGQAVSVSWGELTLIYPQISAESLYSYFQAADKRGRQAILNLLRLQSLYGEEKE